MKMAKPTQLEINLAMQLAAYIEALRSGDRLAPEPGKTLGDPAYWNGSHDFDEQNGDDCRAAIAQIFELAGRSAWIVPMAYATVAGEQNAVIDPDADTLQLHPRIVAALHAAAPAPEAPTDT